LLLQYLVFLYITCNLSLFRIFQPFWSFLLGHISRWKFVVRRGWISELLWNEENEKDVDAGYSVISEFECSVVTKRSAETRFIWWCRALYCHEIGPHDRRLLMDNYRESEQR
jgi:hypothetical protein